MQSASLRVCANVHKASALVWPIYDQHNTSLSEHILLLTMCYFLQVHMIILGIIFTLCCLHCTLPRRRAAGHLYDVFFSSVRVLEISRPFFIQKLSLWGVWDVVRSHRRVTGFRAPSARMIWSDELIFGSARQRQSNLITEPGLKAT